MKPVSHAQRRRIVNDLMLSLTGLCAMATTGVLLFVLGYLAVKGARHLTVDFFTRLPMPVGESGGGMANAIIGSAKVLAIATAIGVPVGFLAGVYLAEYSGRMFAAIVRYATDLLNGVPSIVVGIFAYAVIVRRAGHFSALAGGVALAIMMMPIAVRSTEEFLRAVPGGLREGALALGAPKWRMLATVVIPAAKDAIITGVMLNLARVAGETAPLIFTAFMSRVWSPGFQEPTATLPVMIYRYAMSPYDDWHQQAWAAGFVLLVLILVTNIAARVLVSRSLFRQGR